MDNYDEYGNYIGEIEDDDSDTGSNDGLQQQEQQSTSAPSRAYDEDTNVGGDDELEGMDVDGMLGPSSHSAFGSSRGVRVGKKNDERPVLIPYHVVLRFMPRLKRRY